MQNRELLLKKINAQQNEWGHQVKYLQSKALSFDADKREKFEKYVTHLNQQLCVIEKRTTEIKYASNRVWEKNSDGIVECWQELVHNVDYVIFNYIRIFNQQM